MTAGGDERNVTTGEEREEKDQVRDNGGEKETRERKYSGLSGRNTDDREDERQRKCCREGNTDTASCHSPALHGTM